MKRFVSAVMTLMMLLSMFITTSAATIGTIGASFPNEVEQELAVSVAARMGASDGAYSSSLTIPKDEVYNGVLVDYKATLNMAPIRVLLENISSIVANDSQAKAEFDAADITTEVTVTVEYPAEAEILDTTAGDLVSYNEIFKKKERIENTAERKLVITYVNKDNLTAKELADNKDTYLADLTFVLDDNVKYSIDGHHVVKVSLEGSTQIGFDTKPMTVTYKGGASHIVSAAAEHELVVVPVKPATCDEMGWTEGVRCKTHDYLDGGYGCAAHGLVRPQQTLPKLSHNIVFVPEVDSTCSQTGVKAHYMCLLCKKDFEDENATTVIDKANLVIPTKEHDHENIPEIPATCTENGLTAGAVCKNCNHAHDREIIPALGHSEEIIPATPADPNSCVADSWTEGKKCSVCDTILVPRKPVAATGHNFGEWTVTLPADENTEGSKERECLNGCGTKDIVTIPKLTHEHSINADAAVIEKAATCTEDGLKQNYCACGEKMGEPEVIPAIGHNATKIDSRKATCTEEGILEHYACANCGGLFTDAECKNKITSARIPVDLENHGTNKVKLPAVAPTCETDGLTEGEKCVACKRVIIPQELVPRTGHDLEDIAEKAATCTETGMHAHKHCKVCDKDYVLDDNNDLTEVDAKDYVLPALGHSFKYKDMEVTKEPTETEKGIGRIECERYSECEHYKVVEIAILEHVHNETCEKIIRPATCTVDGLKRIVWTCCNEIKEDNVPIPAKHNARKIDEVNSTCYEKGIKAHWYCSVCDQIFNHENCTEASKTTIEKLTMSELQHNFVFHHENDNFIFNKCTFCNDMQKIAKVKDKDTGKDKAKVTNNGNDKAKKDKVKEDSINEDSEETGRKAHVYPETNLEEIEISSTLEKEIHKNDTEVKKASEEKVVVDITVEVVTVYVEKDNNKEIHELEQTDILDEDRERITETEDLKTIEIYIPVSMRNYVDYQVYRLHEASADYLTTNKNADGEYIVISEDKTKVTIYVNKFSEYAVVGYETKVNPDPVPDPVPTPSYGGGGGSYVPAQATIKFNTNGGTVTENIKVGVGEIITPPEVTREGYILEGWYTDYALTIPFDFSQPIKSNVTLYAKWIALHECRGIHEDNCPCLNFVDLDPTLWYHRGVDYVLNNKMMIGVAKTEFAPDWDITRAMLVTVIWRAEGMPNGKTTTFTDLEEGLYYVPAVEWAAQNGIVTGYSELAFGPNDAITREQFAAIMYRYARSKGFDISAKENANIASYADYNTVSEYAVESMKYAVGSGLIKGRTETTLNPKDATTRAEMATMIYRFYTQLAK